MCLTHNTVRKHYVSCSYQYSCIQQMLYFNMFYICAYCEEQLHSKYLCNLHSLQRLPCLKCSVVPRLSQIICTYMQGSVSELYSVLNYCSFITNLDIRYNKPSHLVLFQRILAFLGPLYLNIHFRISLSNSMEKFFEIFF